MATAELRLPLSVDQARDALSTALTDLGFTVTPTASGSLDVSRGSLGTTLVAGAFAGQDMHVRFDVHFSGVPEGSLASFEHSAAGGFLKGGAIGAVKAGDVVREAAHSAGVRLAERGQLVGVPPVAPPAASGADAATPPVPPPYAPGAQGYPGAAQGYPGAAQATAADGTSLAPYPAPPASDRTNVVAIVAIILGFLFPIGGIVAGAVALAQVKRTGEKGRGLAIGGIIAGSVLTVLYILAAIGLFIFSVFVGATAASGESGSSTDPFAPPVPSESGGVSIAPDDPAPGDPYALLVGECLDDLSSGFVGDENFVDCAAPHTYEVFSTFAAADGAFPGDDALSQAAFTGCDAAFEGFVGIPYGDSTLDWEFVAPTEQTWSDGDRSISCLLYDPAGEVSGTLEGSAR